ncbi:S8 family peptidase [Geminicoccus roseus]|uniref:S8 family peptidase n=1 Tax=Geminicoccus roseus TaxID=404900 RepID=UPI000419C544|nr:S8 family serine peptidase [Geminicoccus roseus]
MATRSYAILRDMGQVSTADPFGLRARGSAAVRPMVLAPPEPRVEVADLAPNDVGAVARDPSVAAVAPIMPTRLVMPFEVAAADAPTAAWGISAVKADESPFTGAGTRVAVLDTGIDRDHPAFAGIAVIEQDFSGTGDGDRQGHGTHCAGTILGRDVENTRIGVARGVTSLLVGKVLGDDGSGDSDMIFRGIQWALQHNADVISMSLGFDFPGLVQRLVSRGWPADLATSVALEAYRGNLRMFDALMEMVEARNAFGQGTVLVAAAGNESRRDQNPDHEIAVSIPAAAQGIVSVGALAAAADGLRVAPFSNTFPQLSAPGVGVLSARAGGGVRALSGTSMATPHVAGVAALWWEALRAAPVNASSLAVLSKLLATARPAGFATGTDPADTGLGIVTAPLGLTQ